MFSLLSLAEVSVVQGFSPLLKHVLPEVLPPLLMGSALGSGGSILEPAGIGSVRHRGSFQQLLTEADKKIMVYAVGTKYRHLLV